MNERVDDQETALQNIINSNNIGSINNLHRKVSMLTVENNLDLLYEYLGHLRYRNLD